MRTAVRELGPTGVPGQETVAERADEQVGPTDAGAGDGTVNGDEQLTSPDGAAPPADAPPADAPPADGPRGEGPSGDALPEEALPEEAPSEGALHENVLPGRAGAAHDTGPDPDFGTPGDRAAAEPAPAASPTAAGEGDSEEPGAAGRNVVARAVADQADGEQTDVALPVVSAAIVERPRPAPPQAAAADAAAADPAAADPASPSGDAGGVDELTTDVPAAPQRGPGTGFAEVTSTYVVQDAPSELSPSELRVDFGAHLEANYQRLVAQMYAITLNPDEAHSAVQDAYSRAWRNWAVIGRSADPTGWVRRVAVRTTMRGWRHVLARFGLARSVPPVAEGLDERTTALLTALRELPAAERRSVVLFHMAGLSAGEIAAVEQVSPTTISTRLDRARRVVIGGDSADLLTGAIQLPGVVLEDDRGYVDEMSMPTTLPPVDRAPHLDDRWERVGTWNGGPDGSWLVSEAPPWDTPNSDPWPGRDVSRSDRRAAPAGDDQVTAAAAGAEVGNDLRAAADDRSWGTAEGDAPLDEFDTVDPDGTTVATAGRAPGSVRGRSEEGTSSVAGTEGDSEDRR